MNLVEIKTGSVASDNFEVVSGASLVTGLLDGDFTRKLVDPTGTEVSGSVTVTIVETTSPGVYKVSFTPNADGLWLLSVFHATYFPAGKHGNFRAIPQLTEDLETEADAATRASNNQTEHDATQSAIAALNDLSTTDVENTVWNASQASHVTAGTFGKYLDIEVSSRESESDASTRASNNQTEHDATQSAIAALNDLSALDTENAVWNASQASHLVAGTFGLYLDTTVSSRESEVDAASRASTNQSEHDATQADIAALNDISSTDVENAVWNAAQASHTGAGTFGKYVDIEVSSRESETDASTRASTNQSEHDSTQADIAALNDLSSSDVENSVWNAAQASHVTAGTFGKYLDIEVSSRESETDASSRASTNQSEHDSTQADIAALNDVSATDVENAVWNASQASHVSAGTFGLFVDTTVSSRASQTSVNDVYTDTQSLEGKLTTGRATNLDNLDAAVSTLATQASITALNDLSASEVENAVWDTTLASHLTAGTTGKALDDAKDASDAAAIADAVWDEALASHLTAGSTGEALDNADAVADPAATAAAVWNSLLADFTTVGTMGAAQNDIDGISVISDAIIAAAGSVSISVDQSHFVDSGRTETANDFFKDQFLTFTTGSNKGQVREITGYNGTTKEFTFDEDFSNTIIPGQLYVITLQRDSSSIVTSGGTVDPTSGVVTINKTPVTL